MISIEEGYQLLAKTFAGLPALAEGERASLEDSLGRYLTRPLSANYDSPSFSQSAMDGVAFCYSPDRKEYHSVGTIAAGDRPDQFKLEPNECVRIMTGAPLPETADTVEMVEHIVAENQGVKLTRPVSRGQHTRLRGENLRRGDQLYPAGTRVSAGVLAGLLSQGQSCLPVKRKLRILIAATGDELVDHRRPLQPGQVYNSNALSMGALLASPAVALSQAGVLPDDLATTSDFLATAHDYDLILLSGGVSMGDFDQIPAAAQAAGYRKIFHKICMKPGKPIWFGAHSQGTLLFGMPGNPVSVIVGTMLFIRPMVQALLSGTFQKPSWCRASVTSEIKNKSALPLFQGAHLQASTEGLQATLLQTSGSGDILGFSTFESLCLIPPQTNLKRGDNMEVLLPFPVGVS